jgi:hypothetical protein
MLTQEKSISTVHEDDTIVEVLPTLSTALTFTKYFCPFVKLNPETVKAVFNELLVQFKSVQAPALNPRQYSYRRMFRDGLPTQVIAGEVLVELYVGGTVRAETGEGPTVTVPPATSEEFPPPDPPLHPPRQVSIIAKIILRIKFLYIFLSKLEVSVF